MADDAKVNETVFISDPYVTKHGWGNVGFVISYENWDLCGTEVLIVTQFPPYGEVK